MSSKYENQTISCVECQKNFTWTSGEQQYYAERNFTPPKRCKDCRRKKHERNGESYPNRG